MKKKIICFVNTNENLTRIVSQKRELFDEFLKSFGEIYILNLINLKIFTKKNILDNIYKEKNLDNRIKVVNFITVKNFLDFAKQKKLIIIINGLSKSPSEFLIYYLFKKINASLIMIFDQGVIGTPIFYKTKIKYFLKSFPHFYHKGFYYIWRILTIINFFPKIELLLESNKNYVEAFQNGLSRKFEKKFPFFKISLYRKILRINSNTYDNYLNYKNQIQQSENKYIVYADTPIDHFDRVSSEGKVTEDAISAYYKNTCDYLNQLSLMYDKKILITMHPNKIKEIEKYACMFGKNKNIIITKKRTIDVILDAEIFVANSSAAIMHAIIFNKKIIDFQSKYSGVKYAEIQTGYNKALSLLSINIDESKNLDDKFTLDKKMNESLKNYEKFINERLKYKDGVKSTEQIIQIIKKEFFI